MKRMMGGALVLATVLATGAIDLAAQQGRRGMQMRGQQGQQGGIERIMQMRDRLELTDNQIAQLDALRVTSVARRTAAMTEMAELHSQLQAGLIQRSDVMAAMEARREDSQGIQEAHRTQLESILTEAQRETLQELGARGRAFRAGQASARRGMRQGMRDQRGPRGGIGARGARDGQRPGAQSRGFRGRNDMPRTQRRRGGGGGLNPADSGNIGPG